MSRAPDRPLHAWKQQLAGMCLGLALMPVLALRQQPALAATFTITQTGDSGPGSLRQAIQAANDAPGSDTLLFRIPTSDPGFGGGVFTIRPASPLPAITDQTFLDGLSQAAFTGNTNPNGPEILLNGSQAGDASGLEISGPNSLIRGLVINGFAQAGILLPDNNAAGIRIESNYIGTNPAGTAAVPNQVGIDVFEQAHENRIGGTTAGARNVISGNVDLGINIHFITFDNVVQGNYIGTNATGTAAVPNGGGVFLEIAFFNRIGGTEPGARNLISGNTSFGIGLEEVFDNQIQGNYIGTDVSGRAALPNGRGVILNLGSSLIGGTSSSARNVISGNLGDGVRLTLSSGDTRIQGNYIGLNAAGTAALPNLENGVAMFDGTDNLVGGTETGARNIISGNGANGVLVGTASVDDRIQGNYIGTNPVGRVSIPNGGNGVLIEDGAQSTLVGGTASGARNLISGNSQDGVRISGANISLPGEPPTQLTVVQGNFIGTDYNGNQALPNGANGVSLVEDTPNNTIGGPTTGARNLIAGNRSHGIQLDGGGTQDNLVAGNYIGTNLGGTVALPNGGNGVYLTDRSHDNRIGGTAIAARNLISGNRGVGVELEFAGALNRLEGNYIGTNASGSGAVPNALGVFVFGVFAETIIGGSEPGARNVISGNRSLGVGVEESSQARILGNLIGTNALGSTAVPNAGDGVHFGNTGSHQVGGTAANERNVISGNQGSGLVIERGSDRIEVQGNYIGLNLAGTTAVPNGRYGVVLFEAGPNTVGGTAVGSRNVISGNRSGGVWLAEGAELNDLLGNYIGTNADGTLAVPNIGHGVEIFSSSQNRIGGAAAGSGNLISGNQLNGILIQGFEPSAAAENDVLGNRIGTTASGTSALPNRGHGVELTREEVHGNRIGGTEAGAPNTIAFNFGDGVLVRAVTPGDNTLVGNPIRANVIFENRGLGINLQPVGEPPSTVTPNDFQDPDPGPNRLQNFPVLTSAAAQPGMTAILGTLNSTPSSSFALDFFRSPAPDPSGFGEGRQYLGSQNVATDASGNASFAFVATGAGAGESGLFTATATNLSTSDTGEFSAAIRSTTATLAEGGFAAAQVASTGQYQITGQVADAAGAGRSGVRIILLDPVRVTEIYSRDWDPGRLQVTETDEHGDFRMAGLARGRYRVLAYAPGVYFAPRIQQVEVGSPDIPDVHFTVAGTDAVPPTVTITTPAAGSQGTSPSLVEGAVADAAGAGVRAVLVRIQLESPEPSLPSLWLDWMTGTWDAKPTGHQTRWAYLNADGTGWKLDLPRLASGRYRLEVQAYDWAGHVSPKASAPFQVR